MTEKPKALGRGLSALISDSKLAILDNSKSTNNTSITMLSIDNVEPNPDQPRKSISSGELGELADSITEYGILQPILVRWVEGNRYQIIAGERRWRAAKIANLGKIPVVIKNLEKKNALEIAIIENIQRQDLSPLDEASAYLRLMDEFSYTQEQLSSRLGKSRSYISNTIRLLKLPDELKGMMDEGKISAGHARALIKSENPISDANQVLNKKLNVRQTEALLKKDFGNESHIGNTKEIQSDTDGDLEQLESRISSSLDMKTKIMMEGDGAKFIIHAKDMKDFDSLVEILCIRNNEL